MARQHGLDPSLIGPVQVNPSPPLVVHLFLSHAKKAPSVAPKASRFKSCSIIRVTKRATSAVTDLIPGVKQLKLMQENRRCARQARKFAEAYRENQRRDEEIVVDFRNIISKLARRLRTLSVDMESHRWVIPTQISARHPAPSLLALTVLRINFFVFYEAQKNGWPLSYLPSLRYLDLIGCAELRGPSFYNNLDKLVSRRSLTFRLPLDLALSAYRLGMFKDGNQIYGDGAKAKLLPSTSHRIFIQLGWNGPGYVGSATSETISMFRSIPDERVVVLEADDKDVDLEEVTRRYATVG